MIKLNFIAPLILLIATSASGANFTTTTGGLTKENEYQIGQAWLRQLRANQQEWNNPLIQEYIYQTVRRLGVNQIDEQAQLTVVLIDSPAFNAFAAIGGIVGVTRGLIESVENEQQLLAVLAHELAHLKQRHVIRSIEENKQLQLLNIASILGGILIAMSGQNEVGEAIFYGGIAQTTGTALKCSREKETEADQVGSQILQAAGYSPKAMFAAQELMARIYDHAEHPLEGYLSTHPLAINRLSVATNEGISQSLSHPDSESFAITKNLVENKPFKLNPNSINAMSNYLLLEQNCQQVNRDCFNALQLHMLSFNNHLPSILFAARIYAQSGQQDMALQLLVNAPNHKEYLPDYWALRSDIEKALNLNQQSALSIARSNWLRGQHSTAINQLKSVENQFKDDVFREINQQLSRWIDIIEQYQ